MWPACTGGCGRAPWRATGLPNGAGEAPTCWGAGWKPSNPAGEPCCWYICSCGCICSCWCICGCPAQACASPPGAPLVGPKEPVGAAATPPVAEGWCQLAPPSLAASEGSACGDWMAGLATAVVLPPLCTSAAQCGAAAAGLGVPGWEGGKPPAGSNACGGGGAAAMGSSSQVLS